MKQPTALSADAARRLAWFHEARFGMFVHYGLYSGPGRGEWLMYEERIPHAEYARLADGFAPRPGCVEAWADLAANAGARYAILVSRHHDGFCLWPTETHGFRLEGRDLVGEWVAALRARGLRVGLYYSLLDWRFPGYIRGPEADPASFRAMVDMVHRQVEELMTRYGPIDVLWYDGNWLPERAGGQIVGHPRPDPAVWRAHELNAMVRRHQPDILINNRSGVPEDLDTPEQHVTASEAGRGWEACMTIGDARGWGYLRHNPTRKSPTVLVEHLAEAAAGEGNFLLNVGPMGDGTVPEADRAAIEAIGGWLARNGEAVYGSRRAPFGTGLGGPLLGPSTAKGNATYHVVVRWPGRDVTIPGVGSPVVRASLLATGEVFPTETRPNGRLVVRTPYDAPPDALPSVIKLEFDGPPAADPFPDHL